MNHARTTITAVTVGAALAVTLAGPSHGVTTADEARPVPVAPETAPTSKKIDGCVVTAHPPTSAGRNQWEIRVVAYKVTATCDANRYVRIWQEVYQSKALGGNVRTAHRTFTLNFGTSGTKSSTGYKELDLVRVNEITWHRVRFQVTSNQVTGTKTGWYGSENRTFKY